MNCVLIIPALEPPKTFPAFIRELKKNGFPHIVVVNDGSAAPWEKIFAEVREAGATVLTHEKNHGKGAALKTAFHHCLKENETFDGMITADCDGQHKIDDIKKVFYTLEKYPDSLVLGSRAFNGQTPKKSFLGNHAAAFFAKNLYGIHVGDTQTGLRGLPFSYAPTLCHIPGKRFEYEINMLIDAARRSIPIRTVTVETVYINHNVASHYRPFRDSFRVSLSFLTNIGRKT